MSKMENQKVMPPKFIAIDFFCGAGGTTRGMIDAGGYVIAGIDKNKQCEQTYVENNRNSRLDCLQPLYLNRDVFPYSTDFPEGHQDDLMQTLGVLIPKYREMSKAPLLFAICAPCQPFTTLSHKKLSDRMASNRERDSSLLLESLNFVKKFNPELIFSENVAGIRDPKFGGVWDTFREQLNELGYVTGSKVICTSRFGIPQQRKRSILLGIRHELVRNDRLTDLLDSELMMPEFNPDTMIISVREAIGHLPHIVAGETHDTIPNHRALKLSELNLKRIAAAKPGESNEYMEKTDFGDLSLNCHQKINKKHGSRCFSDVYTRMHPDKPSPTITTKCYSISNGRYGHYDVSQHRAISLREAAILQSFPENYVFYPTDLLEPIGRMIGNAVPPKLAYFFTEYLVNSIDINAFQNNKNKIKPSLSRSAIVTVRKRSRKFIKVILR